MRNKPLLASLALGLSLTTTQAWSDSVPVLEMNAVDTSSNSPVGNTQGGGVSGGQFEQIQALQREVQNLRGMVEQLNHQVSQMQADDKDRYLDLDRRISQLTSANASSDTTEGASGGSAATQAPASAAAGADSGSTTTDAPASSDSAGEKAEYQNAFQLVRSRSFDQAATAFQQFVQTYPKGELAGNAWYWLGEVYLAMSPPDTAKSREAFAKVVTAFPQNRKVPDALYKLGVLSARRNDTANAKNYLQQVISLYPDSSAAKLAADYLKTLG